MQPRVKKQLREIFDYHKEVAGKRTARNITGLIKEVIYLLKDFPGLGLVDVTLFLYIVQL